MTDQKQNIKYNAIDSKTERSLKLESTVGIAAIVFGSIGIVVVSVLFFLAF